MPPDAFASEGPDAVGGIEDEPEEVLEHPEQQSEGHDAHLARPCERGEREGEGGMQQDEDEELEVEVVSGDGAGAEEQASPAVLDAPRGEVARPAGRPLDLDLEEREQRGSGAQKRDEE